MPSIILDNKIGQSQSYKQTLCNVRSCRINRLLALPTVTRFGDDCF